MRFRYRTARFILFLSCLLFVPQILFAQNTPDIKADIYAKLKCCPCATVALSTGKTRSPYFGTQGAPLGWQAEIKPGQNAELELIIDLNSAHIKTGKLTRDATIISNDPLYPETMLMLEAVVRD